MSIFSLIHISKLSLMLSGCVRSSCSIKCFSESAWDSFQDLSSSVYGGKINLLVSRKSTCCWLQLSCQAWGKITFFLLIYIEYHITFIRVPKGYLGYLRAVQVVAPWGIQTSLKLSGVLSGFAISVEVCRKVSGFEHFLKAQECYDNSFKMFDKGQKYTL